MGVISSLFAHMHKHLRHAHRTLKKYFIPHKGNKYHPHALHTHHTILYGVLFTILKVVLVVVAVMIPAEAFVSPDVLADQATKIIARTNQMRVEQGLPELNVSTLLIRSADSRAKDMGTKEYFSHVSPDGHRLGFFLERAGYPYAEAGENLAMGFSDADGAMNGWMKSPTHYANLVDREFKDIGVGIEGAVYQGKPTVFVAQHFGSQRQAIQPVAPVQAPAPAPAPEPVNPHPAPADPAASLQIAMRPSEPVKKPAAVAVAPTKPVAAKPVVKPTPAPVQAAPIPQPVQVVPEAPVIAAPTPEPAEIPYRYDTSRSYVGWSDKGEQTELEAQAVIEGEVASATVFVNGYTFWLQPMPDNVYVGGITVPESSDTLFKVVLPPTLKVAMKDGRTFAEVIEWQRPKIVSETPWQKYIQAKSWLSKSIPVFEIVHFFYIAALVVLSVALILNIAIEFRKQHPHVIVKTLILLGLLVVYIKF